MSGPILACPKCRTLITGDHRYCPTCGEAVGAELVAELRDLYAQVRALDALIARGLGDRTVDEARSSTLARYLALRHAPKDAPADSPAANAVEATPDSEEASDVERERAAPRAVPAAADRPTATPVVHRAPEPAAARGPVFSWRAFVAEQAIAIMAYLGGFLLLVATLSFEVGGWQVLDNGIKLAVVGAVYAVFGALGFALRRSAHLRTVGGAYLAVFALMTPLVGLAAYRFALAGLGFPVAGMVCVAAAYAAIIYLTLAWRTGFAAYGYLGWTAFVVSCLSVVPWAGVRNEWQLVAATGAALALAAPHVLASRAPAAVAAPARLLAVIAALAAVLGIEGLGILLWIGPASPFASAAAFEVAPFAVAAGALVPLVVVWSRLLRTWEPPAEPLALDGMDWLVVALAAQAGIAMAAALDVSRETMALLLAGLALAVFAVAILAHARAPGRPALRVGVEALAVTLAAIGALLVQELQPPNGPLLACLSVGLAVTLGTTLLEFARWMTLAAGLFLALDYRAVLVAALPPSAATRTPFALDATLLVWFAALALAFWLAALVAGRAERTRVYAAPLYTLALSVALYVVAYLPGQGAAFQTALLSAFTVAAFVVAVVERRPVEGGIATAGFGALAVLPFLADSRGTTAAATMLAAAAVALGARRTCGRPYALPLYAVGLWAALRGGVQLTVFDRSMSGWSALGVPFAGWALLAVAIVAAAVAVLEDLPASMAVPAALALWAVALTAGTGLRTDETEAAAFVLTLALVAAGAALRQLRGRWWSVAWHSAALVGSAAVLWGAVALGGQDGRRLVAALLVYAVAAYLVAAHERAPWVTAVSAPYALLAAWRLPGPDPLPATLVMTFVALALGVVLRLRFGRPWAFGLYAVAFGASWTAFLRMPVGEAGAREALLLVFAGAAYLVATLEREPLAGCAPLAYVAAAVLVQPDPRALLPLALALAILALALGLVAGPRWSWPAYGGAVVAGGYALALGRPQPGFEALALLALALAAYLIAAIEARPDVLPVALLLGACALGVGANALVWPQWQGILAFSALAWLYYAGGPLLWRRLPLRPRGSWREHGFWATGAGSERWRDVAVAGLDIHTYGALLLAAGACLAAVAAPGAFDVRSGATEAAALALLSLAGLLAVHGIAGRTRAPLYLAGEALALAVTWQARWLGADNVQAFVLAPGSYQLLVGAILPGDEHAGRLSDFAPVLSLVGATLLLGPTLFQSFATEPNGVYALALGGEAVLIAGLGVGTRSRPLVLVGSAFVAAAGLRGAALAVDSGVPVPLVIAAAALLLMGGATWLSLRARRDAYSRGHVAEGETNG